MSKEIKNQGVDNCWLDCDPGLDDLFAILMASFSSKINVIGISTVSGNQTIEKVTKNTLTVLNLFGQVRQENDDLGYGGLKYPLLKGCRKPLMREAKICDDIHGESGLDMLNPIELPKIPARAQNYIDSSNQEYIHFTTSMYKCLKMSEKPVVLIATGPLTNIALLLINHPDAVKYIKKIVLMGGAIGSGNITPVAEFNMFVDPEAASYVFESGLPIFMVPLEVTHTAIVNKEMVGLVKSIGSKFTDILVEYMLFYNFSVGAAFSQPACVHDPCAVAFLIDSNMFEYKLMRVDVETTSLLSYGQTVCDVYNLSSKKRNVHVCLKMNVPKFWEIMIESIKQCNEISPANIM
jgi:inosine-uridine nucleoside N-ribohydrolase